MPTIAVSSQVTRSNPPGTSSRAAMKAARASIRAPQKIVAKSGRRRGSGSAAAGGVDSSGVVFSGVEFSGVEFNGVVFSGVVFSGVVFSGLLASGTVGSLSGPVAGLF
ncbi:pentapeptide repeat-containing protein [Cryobacterium lactosi]|uniref:pentapeptide repeat-containing protein n=1 Tax=Cryobacterium lactosi TaxID=1259202 RepID=UPI003B9727A9